MNFTQLEYLVTVGRTFNFTKAANSLYTSRQNVSRTIRALEKELGATLFVQDGQTLALTREGKRALESATRIIDEANRLKHSFSKNETEPNTAHLKIAISSSVLNFYPFPITDVLELDKSVIYHVSEYDCKVCYDRVANDMIDLCIIASMQREFPGCESESLHSDSLYLLVNKNSDLARKNTVKILDLDNQRLMFLPDYEFQFQPFLEKFNARGLSLNNIDEISSFGYVHRAIKNNNAIGLATSRLKTNTPDGTKVVELDEPGTKMNLYAIYKKQNQNIRLIEKLLDTLRRMILCPVMKNTP
jgi:DNA-binding transcriptional LysR family regulator